MAGPRENKLTAPLLALLLLTNRGAAPDDVTKMKPPDWTIARSGGSKVVVFLKELCNEDIYGSAEDYKIGFMEYMKLKGASLPSDVEVSFLPKTVVCESSSRGLSSILDALSQESTRALIGSLSEDMCDVTARLADMWGKPLLSWSCPQVTRGTQRLVPSLEETANAIVGLAKTLSWRSAVIITSDVGWWPVLANKIEVGLQELGVTPRHLYWENQALRGLRSAHARVIILCASLRSSTGETILQAIDTLQLSQTIVLAIDVSSFIPFIPKIVVQDSKASKNNKQEQMENLFDSEDFPQNDGPMEDDSDYILYFSDDASSNIKDNLILPQQTDEENNKIKLSDEKTDDYKLKSEDNSAYNDISDESEDSEDESNNYLINSVIFVNNETVSDILTKYVNNFNFTNDKSNIKNVSLDDLIDKLLSSPTTEKNEEDSRSIKNDKNNGLSYVRIPIAYNNSDGNAAIKTSRKNFTESLPKALWYFPENISHMWENKNNTHKHEYYNNTTKKLVNDFPLNAKNFSALRRNEILANVTDEVKIIKQTVTKDNEASFKRYNETNAKGRRENGNSSFVDGHKELPSVSFDSKGFNATKNNITNFVTNVTKNKHFVFKSNETVNNLINSNRNFENLREGNYSKYKINHVRQKRSWHHKRYEMFENISTEMKKSFMILTSMDSKHTVIDEFIEKSTKNELFEHIHEGMNIVTNENFDNRTDKVFKFLFLDWKEDFDQYDPSSHWRPLVILQYSKNSTMKNFQQGDILSTMNIFKVQPNFDDWYEHKGLEFDEDSCDGDFCIRAQIKVNSIHIVIIVLSALLFCGISVGVGLIIRNVLLKKRLSKGPNKIVLTATDFVFPQVPDSRRVDEGIEAMLCCWLQQLQEFGGPEVVDKPDLLKGSMGSLGAVAPTTTATTATANNRGPSSNGSLAKNNYIVDHRIRYNGDLVQLKNLPSVGTFELKSKAMDCLVLTHGLRHENLNPFIGCLTDPARPALVHEHCSRGSLEDVLMMDEIKLDWTFRLSLLTDLVRGMRYLHSTPLKVHGNLTSRNCVIDARWVLKVTDYGLPAFYEAQGIPVAAKNARDLLWTAPELLRHCGLRRKGSQPGDVYSFGIIMQEVVVRGEPFCMLALSPEEIIEKVKKPPPLIRPSVSKGAAPPEAIHIMRQCWTEQPEMRPDFTQVHDLFRKLNHGRKVNFVDTMFQMLEKYSNNLEELIKERTEQLDMEKKKTEQLLNRMLPSYVADKLKLGMPVDPEEFSEVSIYFSDIVGFTSISAHSTPFQVVDLLNDLYTCFDATINAYNVYKVETIGDAYMVVGGLPVRIADHAEQVATMALDLLHQSGRFKIRHLPRTPLHLRIGLHTGPCCAGVVGLTMPRYCLFGDTVNTASRMESTGSAWRIHLSQATRDKLEAAGGYTLEYRGRTDVKGKGKMPTYWLLGKAGFDKVLPSPPPIGFEDPSLIDRNISSPRIDDQSPLSDTSSNYNTTAINILTTTDSITEKLSPHFSIDRTFFSVEKQHNSPSKQINMPTNGKTEHFLPRVINGERKKPPVLETPNNSQEQGDIGTIPTIKTEQDDSLITIDQTKNELPITNLLHQGKLHTAISQINQYTLGAPVSASEVAAALLGSSTSLVSNRYKDISKYKRSLMIDAHDLSSPYNHYRCLSPSDSNISQLNHGKIFGDRQNPGKMLKRQFSLDRADDSGNAVPESNLATQSTPRVQQRLCKQNSAGAAPDLERIEEVPLSISSPKSYRRRLESTATFPGSSKSISSESLVAGQR